MMPGTSMFLLGASMFGLLLFGPLTDDIDLVHIENRSFPSGLISPKHGTT
jgi:hypothetical protein